jgi:hypothetical protein
MSDPDPHQIKIRIRISIKKNQNPDQPVISRIRIRIKVMRIHNTDLDEENHFITGKPFVICSYCPPACVWYDIFEIIVPYP